jgi:Clostripain family
MTSFALGLYINGAVGIPSLETFQDDAGNNIETLLRLAKTTPDPIPNLKFIPSRYSRSVADFRRKNPTSGVNIAPLWTGIRDLEIKSLGSAQLSSATGTHVVGGDDFMLDAPCLRAFVDHLFSFSSDMKALWLWGHGQGPGITIAWNHGDGAFGSYVAREVPYHWSGMNLLKSSVGAQLTPGEIESALALSIPNGSKLSLVTVEACSVSTIELASTLHKYANYLIASQAGVYSREDWNYETWPKVFNNNAAHGVATIAHALVDDYFVAKTEKRCMSAIKLESIPELLDAIGRIAQNAIGDSEIAATLIEARKRCYVSHNQQLSDVVGANQRVDIEMLFAEAAYLASSRAEPNFVSFSTDCNAVVMAVKGATYCLATPDLKPLVKGLSIWFPFANNPDCITEYARYVYFANSGSAPPELTEFKTRSHWPELLNILIPRL